MNWFLDTFLSTAEAESRRTQPLVVRKKRTFCLKKIHLQLELAVLTQSVDLKWEITLGTDGFPSQFNQAMRLSGVYVHIRSHYILYSPLLMVD